MEESEKQETAPASEARGTPDNNPPKLPPLVRGIKGDLANFSAWQMAWELGYTITIPIVVLALVGRWADKHFGTSPWLLLAGIVVSVSISSALVYRKMKNILRD